MIQNFWSAHSYVFKIYLIKHLNKIFEIDRKESYENLASKKEIIDRLIS